MKSSVYFWQDEKGVSVAGFVSWLIWRSAYLTRVVCWRNRLYVAVNWATTLVFGGDNSRNQHDIPEKHWFDSEICLSWRLYL